MQPPTRISMALLVASGIASMGCSYFSTLEDCDDLAGTINPVLVAIEREEEAARKDPRLYRAIGARYAGVAESLVDKQYRSAHLSKLVTDYAALFMESGSNAVLFASASETKDRKAQKAAAQAARQHLAKQRHLVRRIQAACRGE